MTTINDKLKGSIYGLAFGDAWGYVTEFMKHSKIIKTRPTPPLLLTVSDDTQMSIYNMLAVEKILTNYDLADLDHDIDLQNAVRKVFADAHLRFFYDVDNVRAPGATCMKSLELYSLMSYPVTGREGNINHSNGCGTVMRAPWFGLLNLDRKTTVLLSILQAQTTHGDSVGWISSAVAALTTKDALNGHPVEKGDIVFGYAYDLVSEIFDIDSNLIAELDEGHDEFLYGLLASAGYWNEFLNSSASDDMNEYFGEGWVADEALFNALASFGAYESSVKGIQRLVYTNGDSDSIGAIGGAFFGATNGYDSFATDISGRLEMRYEKELEAVYDFISSLHDSEVVK